MSDYRCRAEAEVDVDNARAVMPEGTIITDTAIINEVNIESPLSHFELVIELAKVTNCHVMADTLELTTDYTGERKYRCATLESI